MQGGTRAKSAPTPPPGGYGLGLAENNGFLGRLAVSRADPLVRCHHPTRQSKLAKQGDVFARMAIVEADYTIGRTWDRDGHHHRVIDRRGNAVLVAKDLRGHPGLTSYEVAVVRYGEAFTVGGRTMPAGERYPSSEQWGVRGWTYPDLESAQARFRSVS